MPRFEKLTGEFEITTGDGAVRWRFARTVEIERAFTLADAPSGSPTPPSLLPLMLHSTTGWEGVLNAEGAPIAYSEEAFFSHVPSALRVEVLRQWVRHMRGEAAGSSGVEGPEPEAHEAASGDVPGPGLSSATSTAREAANDAHLAVVAAPSATPPIARNAGASPLEAPRAVAQAAAGSPSVAPTVPELASSDSGAPDAPMLPTRKPPRVDAPAVVAREDAPEPLLPSLREAAAVEASIGPAAATPTDAPVAPDGVASLPAEPPGDAPQAPIPTPRLAHMTFALGSLEPEPASPLDDPHLDQDPRLVDAFEQMYGKFRRADLHEPLF
jgi:hypothetical protein